MANVILDEEDKSDYDNLRTVINCVTVIMCANNLSNANTPMSLNIMQPK